nr:hypothetical protein [Tanacetum cinerariifolium]
MFSSRGALLWRRGTLLLMLTNKGWVDGNGSNMGGGFKKLGGGRETRGGGDGLEGPDGQLSMKQKSKKSKKSVTEVPQLSDSTHDVVDEHLATTFNDPLLSGEDRLKLTKLMELCTKLHSRVLALETTKANQALEIGSLKRRVKKLKRKANKKTYKFKRLYKICSSIKVESSEDASLGDSTSASSSLYLVFFISHHYKQPAEFKNSRDG